VTSLCFRQNCYARNEHLNTSVGLSKAYTCLFCQVLHMMIGVLYRCRRMARSGGVRLYQAADFSQTSVYCGQPTRHHIPEDCSVPERITVLNRVVRQSVGSFSGREGAILCLVCLWLSAWSIEWKDKREQWLVQSGAGVMEGHVPAFVGRD